MKDLEFKWAEWADGPHLGTRNRLLLCERKTGKPMRFWTDWHRLDRTVRDPELHRNYGNYLYWTVQDDLELQRWVKNIGSLWKGHVVEQTKNNHDEIPWCAYTHGAQTHLQYSLHLPFADRIDVKKLERDEEQLWHEVESKSRPWYYAEPSDSNKRQDWIRDTSKDEPGTDHAVSLFSVPTIYPIMDANGRIVTNSWFDQKLVSEQGAHAFLVYVFVDPMHRPILRLQRISTIIDRRTEVIPPPSLVVPARSKPAHRFWSNSITLLQHVLKFCTPYEVLRWMHTDLVSKPFRQAAENVLSLNVRHMIEREILSKWPDTIRTDLETKMTCVLSGSKPVEILTRGAPWRQGKEWSCNDTDIFVVCNGHSSHLAEFVQHVDQAWLLYPDKRRENYSDAGSFYVQYRDDDPFDIVHCETGEARQSVFHLCRHCKRQYPRYGMTGAYNRGKTVCNIDITCMASKPTESFSETVIKSFHHTGVQVAYDLQTKQLYIRFPHHLIKGEAYFVELPHVFGATLVPDARLMD